MSRRVMQILADLAPASEIYSIDECFLDFSELPQDVTAYGQQICRTVRQWTGIPISIGIGPSKTLAKLANRLAKKGLLGDDPVLDWQNLPNGDAVLATTALEDLWGISRRWAAKLQGCGIANALDLKNADPKRLRQQFGVVMERIASELGGISCLELEQAPPPRRQILTSRSFGSKLTEFEQISAAVSHFAARSAEKCRQHGLAACALTVFIETSRFDRHSQAYSNNATLVFPHPSQSTPQLIAAAQFGLQKIFKIGYQYQRAGVLVPELQPQGLIQPHLFDDDPEGTNVKLMTALDNINRKYGKQSLRYASEIKNRDWHMRQQFKSPSYTTRLDQLWLIDIAKTWSENSHVRLLSRSAVQSA